jgi:hypothetical protein
LHGDPHHTFRFADDRVIPRSHLEGVPASTPVAVYRIDPATEDRRELLVAAVVGDGGWVDLAEPLRVRAGAIRRKRQYRSRGVGRVELLWPLDVLSCRPLPFAPLE